MLDGGVGSDTMTGGIGNDTYVVEGTLDQVIERPGQGTDTVLSSASLSLGADLERLFASSAAATTALNLTGNELANSIQGNAGANILDGLAGIDVMGGLGGNDTYRVDNAADQVREAVNGGADRVLASVTYGLRAGSEVETLATSNAAGTGVISFFGNEFNNTITGNAGLNQLKGLNGNDNISGLAGNDLIWGGLGSDTMSGGLGLDHFLFDTPLNPTTNLDRIPDFSHADDTIRLAKAVFAAIVTAAGSFLAASEFRVGAAAADADDRIIYNSATGAVLYDADGNKVGAPIQFAILPAGLGVTNGDFLLF
jgi:Ca2+-binding RTX toxin-like protein